MLAHVMGILRESCLVGHLDVCLVVATDCAKVLILVEAKVQPLVGL